VLISYPAVPSQQPSLNLFGSVTGQYPLQGGLFSTPKEENTSTFQVFDNPRAQKLLGLIDHLRQNGLSQDVALPEVSDLIGFMSPGVLSSF
jgi:hypothetical protein